jgi:hypothetical protein
MANPRWSLLGILVLQVIALIIYPPTFFTTAPQAAVLPPALLLLMVLALVGMNTGILTPLLGRTSLTFVQGINVVVRLMMLLPNSITAGGNVHWLFLILQLLGIGLSWFTITQMEKRPLATLLLVKRD